MFIHFILSCIKCLLLCGTTFIYSEYRSYMLLIICSM